jgi:hypothetical protein
MHAIIKATGVLHMRAGIDHSGRIKLSNGYGSICIFDTPENDRYRRD